ncbi:hypothetical protein ABFX02_05G083500 [Erythranthe guttata]
MLHQKLLLKCFCYWIITQLNTSDGKLINNNPNPKPCDPSSCGEIRNISYPFRLNTDPKRCGHSKYELSCENNTTSLYLNSQKYLVKAINYHNSTIRLTDAAVQNDDICSFPNHSLSGFDFGGSSYTYSIKRYDRKSPAITWPMTFVSCPYDPVNNSQYPHVLDTSHCSDSKYSYVKFGALNGSYVMDLCRIDLMVMTSLNMKSDTLSNLSQVHSCLVYGFELSWFIVLCGDRCEDCGLNGETATCLQKELIGPLWVLLQALYVIFAFVLTTYLGLRILIGLPSLFVLLIIKFRKRHLSLFSTIEAFLQSNTSLTTIRYSYSDIRKMTRGFREKLGEGGCGSVYKGKLRSGHDVAVKLLNKTRANGQEFINEVATIGRIHHVNVVKLVGYCAERSKRALVYDFMPNGSLEKYLSSKETSNWLSLARKFEIAVGVARGIEYLHIGCNIQILHFDIKPHNILLDDNFTPKISDFGLAKSYSTENTTVTLTAVRGTIGYVAPELMNRSIGRVSYKADVYSFGMLLMEMLGLNRCTRHNDNKSSQYFPYWIYDHLNEGNDIEIGNADKNDYDDDDDDDDNARKMRRKMTIVGLWCIQMSPTDRPSMSEVLKMLQGEIENLQIPPQPSQLPDIEYFNDRNWDTESTGSMSLLCNDSLTDQ